MTESQFSELVQESLELLRNRQQSLWDRFRLADCEQFHWDQPTGEITFSHAGRPMVKASIQFVGSFSQMTSTWLWSWANPSFDLNVKTEMLELKEFGILNDIGKLSQAKWESDEIDGWEMTCVAAKFFDAEGAYRTEEKTGFTYMILKNVHWVEGVAT